MVGEDRALSLREGIRARAEARDVELVDGGVARIKSGKRRGIV